MDRTLPEDRIDLGKAPERESKAKGLRPWAVDRVPDISLETDPEKFPNCCRPDSS